MKYDEMLFSKYQKTTLNRKEVAAELSISLSTLERHLEDGTLPIRFKRIGKGPKSRYVFPIKALSDYLEFAA
jgi:predicted DNA-binding transcriptional regulator AlpA